MQSGTSNIKVTCYNTNKKGYQLETIAPQCNDIWYKTPKWTLDYYPVNTVFHNGCFCVHTFVYTGIVWDGRTGGSVTLSHGGGQRGAGYSVSHLRGGGLGEVVLAQGVPIELHINHLGEIQLIVTVRHRGHKVTEGNRADINNSPFLPRVSAAQCMFCPAVGKEEIV